VLALGEGDENEEVVGIASQADCLLHGICDGLESVACPRHRTMELGDPTVQVVTNGDDRVPSVGRGTLVIQSNSDRTLR
jgi:hypothetical protein